MNVVRVVADKDGEHYFMEDGSVIHNPLNNSDPFPDKQPTHDIDVDVERALPTMKDLVANAAKSVKEIAKSGAAVASDEEYRRRLAICHECRHLTENGRCANLTKDGAVVARGCGCYMIAKAKFAAMSCPNKKW